jgi:hypothetical protein
MNKDEMEACLESIQIQENQNLLKKDTSNLRPVIVDGNNVGMSATVNVYNHPHQFSFARIVKVVEFFEYRNHQIFVILPQWRKDQIMNTNSGEQLMLLEMEKKKQLHCTPGAKRVICDDMLILRVAAKQKGVIVSNDDFNRATRRSNDDEFKQVLNESLLMYAFIGDDFFPVDDPMGKSGPRLDNFLLFKPMPDLKYSKACPYQKKCTYGSKCKYLHPERQNGAAGDGSQFKTAHPVMIEAAKKPKMSLEVRPQTNIAGNKNKSAPDFLMPPGIDVGGCLVRKSWANSFIIQSSPNLHFDLVNNSEGLQYNTESQYLDQQQQQSSSSLNETETLTFESANDSVSSLITVDSDALERGDFREKLLLEYTQDQVDKLFKTYDHVDDFETLYFIANSMFLLDERPETARFII